MNWIENKEGIASKKVLVVDRDDTNSMLAEKFLELTWIPKENIVLAKNWAEAVELAKNELFDVILMETALPWMNAVEVSQEIRAQHTSNSPKIVAYTANAFITRDLQATEAFDGIMIKPINRENFSAKILEILNIRN